jgi:plasmid stabilization system protein ParE
VKYRVLVHRLALEDLDEAYALAAKMAPVTALRWLDRFQEALTSLETLPYRQPLARESGKVGIEVRELLFGKSSVFRVIFTIDQDAVRILRIRRAQRQLLTPEEIVESLEAGEE